ncbi:hypothetical protein PV327_010097 [Microctonus hyperodae]|uniref:Uncharacterized protein n=1 Tax=Microctonus hyperodae TaxID=165561 RepID=A0AA39F2C3_MICHY|nr:hypothetical protein PV327_010097 [Microctonus hyperodae]
MKDRSSFFVWEAVVSRDLCEVSQILEVAVGMRQDSQRTTNNNDLNAICDNDVNQLGIINERQPVLEPTESDDRMGTDSDNSEDSIIESTQRFAKKRKIDAKETKTSKKIRWTDYEVNAASTVFASNLTNMKLPSSFEIREFLRKHPNVTRTKAQVRTWMNINNSDYEEPNEYAVVCFLPRRGSGYDEIDLVPFSWINTMEDKTYCYYPNTKKDFKKRDKYLEKKSLPKKSWTSCENSIHNNNHKEYENVVSNNSFE